MFQAEFLIKTIDDYKIFEYIYNDLVYYPNYEEVNYQINLVGDDGLVLVNGPGTPMLELIELFMGLEKFSFHLYDHPKELKSLMEVMFVKNMEAYEITVKSPAEGIMGQEDAGTSLVSPKIFGELAFPVLTKYVAIAHKYRKIFVIHSCGLLDGVIELLGKTGADAIDSLTPPPTGNIEVKEAKCRLGDRVCVIGGLDPTVLRFGSLDEIKVYTKNLLKEVKGGGNFIFSTGDALPADTPMENLKTITETVNQYGVINR